MRFFLDFEATRFSNRIISIGCVADNGAKFETLVKPINKGKVDNFITNLTGITKEMAAAAPSADEAFNQLFDFIELTNDNNPPVYYCYGNTDVEFLKHTAKYMEDVRACICAQAIQGTIIDFSITVKKFFNVPNDIALRKIYSLINPKNVFNDKHNALEDALMLKNIVNNLYHRCKPGDKETLLSMPSQRATIYPQKKKSPEVFLSWDNQEKWESETFADEINWKIKYIEQHNNQKIKYFNDVNVAALWVIKYLAHNVSPKNKAQVKKIETAISSAIIDKKCRYNGYWEYNN